MDDAALIDLLGLSGLVTPSSGRTPSRGIPIPVEDGLSSMAADIDRATRAWIDGVRDEEADPAGDED